MGRPHRSNWARCLTYGATEVVAPSGIEEVVETVRRCSAVKALGTGHSFSDIADTDGTLLSTENLNHVLEISAEGRFVRVESGIRYGELSQCLNGHGLALHNLASLPHISVAGACATATHGSGVRNGSLASAVTALSFVAGDGSLVALSRAEDPAEFHGAVVSLGALGVVTELTLEIEPAYEMTQTVYDDLPLAALRGHFDEVMSSAYSVSLFTRWTSPNVDQVWIKRRLDSDSGGVDLVRLGAIPARCKRSPVPEGVVENCTDQLGAPGPWCDRLPHFRLGFTPSSGEELQTEYFVAREHAWEALELLDGIRGAIAPILQTTEIRTIAADSYWMSPCFERDSVAIHFTWKKDWDRVGALLPRIESMLAPFEPRPHWAKLCAFDPAALRRRYPLLGKFKELKEKYDPRGKFANRCLRSLLR